MAVKLAYMAERQCNVSVQCPRTSFQEIAFFQVTFELPQTVDRYSINLDIIKETHQSSLNSL